LVLALLLLWAVDISSAVLYVPFCRAPAVFPYDLSHIFILSQIAKAYANRTQDDSADDPIAETAVAAEPVSGKAVEVPAQASVEPPIPVPTIANVPAPAYAKFKRRKIAGSEAKEPSSASEAVTQLFPKSSKMTPEKLRSATRLGRNSFLIATLLAGGTVFAGTYALCSYHDVWTARAFAQRMRTIFSGVTPGEQLQKLNDAGRKSWMNGFLRQWIKMPDASEEPDPIQASKVLGLIDTVAKTEIDLCDVLPFLKYLPAVKRARESEAFKERYFKQHDDVLQVLQQLNDEYLSDDVKPVSITPPPAPVGWGEWVWNGVSSPYRWVRGK
jgi:hypothetical protein